MCKQININHHCKADTGSDRWDTRLQGDDMPLLSKSRKIRYQTSYRLPIHHTIQKSPERNREEVKRKIDKTLFEPCRLLAPPAGLEPATSWLTVMRSTDWAKEEYKAEWVHMGFYPCHPRFPSLWKVSASTYLTGPSPAKYCRHRWA